jgi:hypothetical protein
MDNPEKLSTLNTQDENKQNKKHNTIRVQQLSDSEFTWNIVVDDNTFHIKIFDLIVSVQ